MSSAREAAETLVGLFRGAEVAVLIPCHNEELTIARVVEGFKEVIPEARIYVYDNLSTDATSTEAKRAGALVRTESQRGKGNVVRRMFSDIDADVYVIVDGDGTYDPRVAPSMVHLLLEQRLDMVVGTRRDVYADAHRRGHGMGNRLFNVLYRWLFGGTFSDIFSGYRVFSRRFVKSFPALSPGFEIETEMSVHASQLRMPVQELPTQYGERPPGSQSKLNTFRDAGRILKAMLILVKEVRPLTFYGTIGGFFFLASLVLSIPIIGTFLETGLVPRLPTAVLSASLALLGALCVACGLILDSVARGRLEQKRSFYLALPTLRERARR